MLRVVFLFLSSLVCSGCVILKNYEEPTLPPDHSLQKIRQVKIVFNSRFELLEKASWSSPHTPTGITMDLSKINGKLFLTDNVADHQPSQMILCGPNCKESDFNQTLYVDMYERTEPSVWMPLSILTLTIVPSNETHYYRVKGVLVSKDGKYLADFEDNTSVEYWYQLLLIFAAPFQDYKSAPKSIFTMVTNFLVSAESKGLLN